MENLPVKIHKARMKSKHALVVATRIIRGTSVPKNPKNKGGKGPKTISNAASSGAPKKRPAQASTERRSAHMTSVFDSPSVSERRRYS